MEFGPMSLTYSGDATVTEVDRDAHTARIEAAGREKRGAGTATADVRAELHERDGATVVVVTTDLAVTGRPSQFGRGVMGEVGEKIIDRFAENLRAQLDEDHARAGGDASTDDDASTAADADAAADGPRRVAPVAPRDEALDLMDVAGPAAAKRLVPVVVAAVALLLWVVLRRREDD